MLLSIVVTIVDGKDSLTACLEALKAQNSPPDLEVLIPYDSTIAWVADLASAYPDYRFIALGSLETEKSPESPAGQHELYDRRRAWGLECSTGEIIAILEDRGIPDANWASTLVRLHQRLPHAVIGGAVECGVDRALNWAVYFCDFGRYQLPFPEGSREYVTDVNIAYKREALEKTRSLWQHRYHETTVNWALVRDGEILFLSPEPVVRQVRRKLSLPKLVHERFDWGRLFAFTRAREAGTWKSIVYAALCPLLPFLLLARHGITQYRKKKRIGRFVTAAPAVFLLLTCWSFGEMTGYLTRQP